MNERLNISDLAALLAEHTGKDRKNTELFLRELVAVISDALLEERIVKVKGLGTFKVIQVEERESIHVNTGERFVIPGHAKFTFTPDKDLRNLVNKPFASFETTELNEGVVFPTELPEPEDDSDVIEDEPEEAPLQNEVPAAEPDSKPVAETETDAAEVVAPVVESVPTATEETDMATEPVAKTDLDKPAATETVAESDLGTTATADSAIITETEPDLGTVAASTEETESEQTQDTIETEKISDEMEEEVSVAEKSDEPIAGVLTSTPVSEAVSSTENRKASKTNKQTAVWLVLLLIVLGVGCYFIFMNHPKDAPKLVEQVAKLSEDVSPPESVPQTSSEALVDTVVEGEEISPAVAEEVNEPDKSAPVAESAEPKAQAPVVVKIVPDSRLTLIALEHYGHKVFWVYIYEYNKAIIKNPNNIQIGTELVIPDASLYGIDANNPESVAKAKAKQAEINAQF